MLRRAGRPLSWSIECTPCGCTPTRWRGLVACTAIVCNPWLIALRVALHCVAYTHSACNQWLCIVFNQWRLHATIIWLSMAIKAIIVWLSNHCMAQHGDKSNQESTGGQGRTVCSEASLYPRRQRGVMNLVRYVTKGRQQGVRELPIPSSR